MAKQAKDKKRHIQRSRSVLGFPSWRARADPEEQLRKEKMLEMHLFPEMMDDLASLHGIDSKAEDKWYLLSLSLAKKYIPDFQFTRVGRPRKWTREDQIKLVLEISRRWAPDKSVGQVCLGLSKLWGMKAKSLAALYRRAKQDLKRRHPREFDESIREELLAALATDLRQK
jgi:hypothetical protein